LKSYASPVFPNVGHFHQLHSKLVRDPYELNQQHFTGVQHFLVFQNAFYGNVAPA
jgi:hypothetical protein